MRRDNWAEWLPEALADVLVALAALGGARLSRRDTLESWGLLGRRERERSADERETLRAREWARFLSGTESTESTGTKGSGIKG